MKTSVFRPKFKHLAMALVSVGAIVAKADGTVNVVCGVQAEWCSAAATAFQRESGIKVNMTNKAAGEVLAQLRAEANNPKIDVWFGGSGDLHLDAATTGLTEPYTSPHLKELHRWAQVEHELSGSRTVGVYTGALGFSFNTELLTKKKMEAPKCWSDLIRPELKGEVQMANPNSSSTAYIALASIVQVMGEEKAFDFLKKLHANISSYPKSGVGAVKAVARGETMVGISMAHDAISEVQAKFPVGHSTPCEGTGYEIGAMSIIKGARNLENAKKFYDWALTPAAQSIAYQVAKQFQIQSNKATPAAPGAPKFSEIKFINYDIKKYGDPAERARLLGKWEKEVNSLPR